jgi:hypothetical protein
MISPRNNVCFRMICDPWYVTYVPTDKFVMCVILILGSWV